MLDHTTTAMAHFLAWASLGFALLLLEGCAQPEALHHLPTSSLPQRCLAFYSELDRAVHDAAVEDGQYHRIPGYPSLRSSRFLASFAAEINNPQQYQSWLAELHQLGQKAWQIEWANLPKVAQQRLHKRHAKLWATHSNLAAVLGSCQKTRVISKNSALLAASQVPTEYRRWKRILGLYYLSALPVMAGIQREESKVHQHFSLPPSQLPSAGQLLRYGPANPPALLPAQIGQMLKAHHHPLAIPKPDPATLAALFQHFAPIWVVDTLTEDDKIGVPFWSEQAIAPQVATAQPTLYTHISYTRFYQTTLLQLNYTIWFPARPSKAPWDILAGAMDGLNWRVTLDQNAKVLTYDVIHNCGCYHWFFPHPSVSVRTPPNRLEEWALIPQQAPIPAPAERIALRLSHTAHALQSIYSVASDQVDQVYSVQPYQQLRSLPIANGERRSLFEPTGLVAGTQRKERWLLWPMGIDSPGAMRQKGRYATAFVGRRHYDEARLLERYFLP